MRARRRPPRRSSVRRRRGARRSSNNWYQSRSIRGAAGGGRRHASPVEMKKEGRRPSGRVCARGRRRVAQRACARAWASSAAACACTRPSKCCATRVCACGRRARRARACAQPSNACSARSCGDRLGRVWHGRTSACVAEEEDGGPRRRREAWLPRGRRWRARAGAWASCAAGRACARPWSGDREAIVNVIVWAIRRLQATQRRRPAAMEEIVAATADVDDEPTSSVKTGVRGAGFRGRLLG